MLSTQFLSRQHHKLNSIIANIRKYVVTTTSMRFPHRYRPQESRISDDAGPSRPNVLQYIAYCYGRVLPDSMRDWVRNDLADKGATFQTMMRVILVLAPFWLIPTTLYVHAAMTLPILTPYALFAHALNTVWRRHRLGQHGLDPNLVDALARTRDAHIHRAYIERYGPRPPN
jgi:hypothetical protein